ncbi:MAG: redoxin domain-containing protein [Chloroflexota bacterium]
MTDKHLNATPLEYSELAPTFSLDSIDGQTFTRGQFRNKCGLVLIFFQPVPDVIPLLKKIGADLAEYQELNARILGIGRADRTELATFASTLALPFTLLADPTGEAWKAYCRTDLPGYAVFVLDLYGGVDAQKVTSTVKDLPEASQILEWTRAAQYKCSI